jgi:hypothetical protein
MSDRDNEFHSGETCAIAARLGEQVPCPRGGCALLRSLGHDARAHSDEACPVELIADRAGFEPVVVRTLDELRRELDRVGVSLSAARAARSHAARHAGTLTRWPRSERVDEIRGGIE